MIQLIILDIKDRTRLGQMSNSFMRVSISFSLVSKKKKKKVSDQLFGTLFLPVSVRYWNPLIKADEYLKLA